VAIGVRGNAGGSVSVVVVDGATGCFVSIPPPGEVCVVRHGIRYPVTWIASPSAISITMTVAKRVATFPR
jgi:hypothetical protein